MKVPMKIVGAPYRDPSDGDIFANFYPILKRNALNTNFRQNIRVQFLIDFFQKISHESAWGPWGPL